MTTEPTHVETEATDAVPAAETEPAVQPPVRDSGPVEGDRGNREVPPAPTAALEARLTAAEAERDDYFDRLQRLGADFDNYRKRAARDQAAFAERATERLVTELLPVLDALEGALEAAGEHAEAKLEEGVRLVHRQLADALGKQGVAEIDTDGKFDPHVHEAVLSQPSEAEEGSIVNVLQKGYRLGEKVVRPARVAVAAPVQPEAVQPPVRESGPVEGVRGNREVPPTEDR